MINRITKIEKYGKREVERLYNWHHGQIEIEGNPQFYNALFELMEIGDGGQRHKIWQGFRLEYEAWWYWKFESYESDTIFKRHKVGKFKDHKLMDEL